MRIVKLTIHDFHFHSADVNLELKNSSSPQEFSLLRYCFIFEKIKQTKCRIKS